MVSRFNAVPGKNQMSLDELFAPHMPQLYHAAVRVLRHPQDSEDAVQEGLLAAFRHLSQFQGRAKFSTWLHRIVVNVAFMKLRHRKREISVASIEGEFENGDLSFERLIPDQRQNPEEEYSDIERSRILAEGIRKVPQRYRVVLQMCDIEGLMEKEAAQRLGTLVSVVKSRRYRGRRMLLRRLGYTSFPEAAHGGRGTHGCLRHAAFHGAKKHRGSCRKDDGLMHTC
jgi:RNA polymerase sigma-70 factor, ECF subfamily